VKEFIFNLINRVARSIIVVNIVSVILLGFTVTPVLADVFIYNSPSVYNADSDRESSTSNGIYLSGKSVEFGYEKTNLEFKSGLLIEQEDMTAVWKFNINLTLLRLGLHYSISDDAESDGKATFILEVLHYDKNVYGNSIYFTRYQNDTDVWQLSSRFGSHYKESFLPGTLYLQIQGDLILINNLTESKNYFTVDLNAHLQVNSWWALEVGGWYGEKRSAVSGSGFIVYNLNDLYSNETRLRTTLNVSENLSFKFGAQVNSRTSAVTKETYNVFSYLAGINYAF